MRSVRRAVDHESARCARDATSCAACAAHGRAGAGLEWRADYFAQAIRVAAARLKADAIAQNDDVLTIELGRELPDPVYVHDR